jgi:hypothetical protein
MLSRMVLLASLDVCTISLTWPRPLLAIFISSSSRCLPGGTLLAASVTHWRTASRFDRPVVTTSAAWSIWAASRRSRSASLVRVSPCFLLAPP